MSQLESAAKISTVSADHISKWSMLFLISLPFLVLLSRVSSDITASLCTLFLAIFWFKNPEHAIRKQAWFKAFLVLWLFMCVTSYFTADPKYVFTQSLIAIRWPAFALVLSCLILNNENRLKLFERSALVLFIFIALDSILQYFIGRDVFGHLPYGPTRLTGPFSNPIPGNYALRIYLIALFALLSFSARFTKSNFLIIMLLMMVFSQLFVFLTGERTAFVLFGFVNTVVFVALAFQEKLSYRSISAMMLGVILMAISTVMLAPQMYQRTVKSLIDKLENFQSSDYYDAYHLAYIIWQKAPLIGVGTRYFDESCKALAVGIKPEICYVHPHHIYFEWAVHNGLIGLALFLVVLFFIFKLIWQHLDFKNSLLQSVLIFMAPVLLFFPFTSSMSLQSNSYAGLVWLLVAWAIARAMVNGKNSSKLGL